LIRDQVLSVRSIKAISPQRSDGNSGAEILGGSVLPESRCSTPVRWCQVQAALDTDTHETKIKVAAEELARLNLKRDEFHGDLNYTPAPR
jgi:hypothetical protein